MKRRDFMIGGAGLAGTGIIGCSFHREEKIQLKKDNLNQSILDQLVGNVILKKYIYGAVFYISSDDNGIDLISASGNINEDKLNLNYNKYW